MSLNKETQHASGGIESRSFYSQYFPNLDGLRAIAVLSVIIFHLNASYLPIGFIGVDLFFVISGFIITRNILFGIEKKEFSLVSFYLGRVRRILPAMATVLVISLPFFIILQPEYRSETVQSAFYSIISLANYFFATIGDYFGPGSEFSPFLHYWSLSVEEQFYVVWPTLLLLTLSKGKKIAFAAMSAIAALSIMHLLTSYEQTPVYAFFSSLTRGYQFAFGGLFALIGGNERFQRFRKIVALPSLFISVSLIACLPGASGQPGPWIVLLSALFAVTVYGATGSGRILNALLSNKVSRHFGKISYSLYLTHWPISVWLWQVIESDFLFALSALTLTYLTASLLHICIEKPMRFHWKRASYYYVVGCLAVVSWIAVNTLSQLSSSGASISSEAQILEKRIAEPLDADVVPHEKVATNAKICLREATGFRNCHTDVLVVGDSHAPHALLLAENLFSNQHVSSIWHVGCPPLKDIYRDFPPVRRTGASREKLTLACKSRNAKLGADIARSPAKVVIIASRWSMLLNPLNMRAGWGDEITFVAADGSTWSEGENNQRIAESLHELILEIEAADKRVILLGQVPFMSRRHFRCLSNSPEKECVDEFRTDMLLRLDQAYATLSAATKGTKAELIDTRPYFCIEDRCSFTHNGQFLYRDFNHLNEAGAKRLADALPWPDM